MGYICDGSNRNEVNQSFEHVVRGHGLVDSVTGLLYNYNADNRTCFNYVFEVNLTCCICFVFLYRTLHWRQIKIYVSI